MRLPEDAGYHVTAASDGREALAWLLERPPPDLILLDINMPGLDGWGLMAEIKERPALAAIPIVVMSGAGESVLNLAPVSAGYLSKPFEVSTLLETVAGALWRRHRRPSGVRGSPGGGSNAG